MTHDICSRSIRWRIRAKGHRSSPQRINNAGGKTDKLAVRLMETSATRKEQREISFNWEVGEDFTAEVASKQSLEEGLDLVGKWVKRHSQLKKTFVQ